MRCSAHSPSTSTDLPSTKCGSSRSKRSSRTPSSILRVTPCFTASRSFTWPARSRPYDEEFLLAALLHDVGLAIDPQDHVAAGVEALRGLVTERTLWLIEHHVDLSPRRERALSARLKRELAESEYAEDLRLLREIDNAGRVPGQPVDTLEEVLDYLKGLEHESYLDE